MQYSVLYEEALAHGHARRPDFDAMLSRWRRETPAGCTDQDLLAEYAWIVVGCGLSYHATQKIYDRLAPLLLSFAPAAVALRESELHLAAAGVLRAPRKLNPIFSLAGELAREPGQMVRLAALPWRQVQGWMLTLPLVGPNNSSQFARNLGWDVAARAGPVARLAEALGTNAQALCEAVADEVGERVRVVDLVLWQWLVDLSQAGRFQAAELARLVGPAPA